MKETRARVWRSLRHDPRAGHILIVARLAGRPWAVFPLEGNDVPLFEGPFVQVWDKAVKLGRQGAEGALIVAVNAEGEIIAREQIDPVGSQRFATRPREGQDSSSEARE
jgi:hypothetical protein